MFNNIFDSFQDSIAEAKEEREQLDRLLTISTPRERRIVVVIILILLIFVAWLFFGNTTRSLVFDGMLDVPEETLSEENQSIRVIIWSNSEFAPDIQAGMPVVIELDLADGETTSVHAKIEAISAIPVTKRQSMFLSAATVAVYQVNLAVEEILNFTSLAGRKCRVVIQFGSQSPISLFRSRLI